MSSAAERARLKAARMAPASRPAPTVSDDNEPEPGRPVPVRAERTETVKTSLHLAPELHRQYVTWCTEAARELGRGRVPGSEPLRVFVRMLLTDDELRAAVIEQLRRDGPR